MTLYPPLWATAGSYSDEADRQFVNRLFPSAGVLDVASGALKVSQRAAGANMTVDVAAGGAIVEGTHAAAQGRYLCSSDAVENRAVNAAPGAGTSRIDRIAIQALDSGAVGSGNTETLILYIAGTAAASPSPPALPSSALGLARFTVLSSTTSITDGMIQDDRVAANILQRGNILVEYPTSAQTITNGTTQERNLSSPTVRPSGYAASLFFSAGTPTRMLIPWTGVWESTWTAELSGGGGFGWKVVCRADADTTNVAATTLVTETTISLSTGPVYLTAGQYLRWLVQNNTGVDRTSSSPTTYARPRLLFRGAV